MTYRLHYAPDNASLIVRLALLELQVPFDCVLVDRSLQAQKSPQYLRLNPMGRIPAMETPDGTLFETAAMLLWLVDRHGGLGPDAQSAQRGDFLKWLFFMSNTLHADLRALFYPDTYFGGTPTADFVIQTQTRVDHALRLLDQNITEWHTPDCVWVTDFYICVVLRWCALYPQGGNQWFDLTHYRALQQLAQQLDTHPATQQAIQDEGLHQTPFTAPRYATPPYGTAI